VHDFYLDVMHKSPTALEPYYGRRLLDLEVDQALSGDEANPHAVTARLDRVDPAHEGQIETIKARYVVGCDGARSVVRKSIGRTLHGDSANHAWGVMDVLAVTDFPDVRFKTLIQSAKDGSMLIIPREGGYLFRLYIEMDKLDAGERVSNRNITSDDLIAAAQRIFNPYKLDVKQVPWWSVYEIGQRLCDKFDDVPAENPGRLPRVFIAGDACHTHSPKAGQGMNVSMQDGFNLGWKLASVLRQRSPSALLHTYSSERQAIAKELIDFDREWAEVLSSASKSTTDGDGKGFDPAETQRYFVRHGRYTAGTAAHYRPSILTGEATHQHLATGLTIGMRLHSAPVIRVADGKPMQLGHTVKADGRWRIFAFAGAEDPAAPDSGIRKLCSFLADTPQSPVRKFTPMGDDIDSVIDARAVFQQSHHDLAIETMPGFLLPAKGRFKLPDYEKMFCADSRSGHDIFTMRGIDRQHGCMVVVRPDQYVAHVLPLDGVEQLAAFFGGFMMRAH
jgi:phenol 2-monooxygenase (NADPH)